MGHPLFQNLLTQPHGFEWFRNQKARTRLDCIQAILRAPSMGDRRIISCLLAGRSIMSMKAPATRSLVSSTDRVVRVSPEVLACVRTYFPTAHRRFAKVCPLPYGLPQYTKIDRLSDVPVSRTQNAATCIDDVSREQVTGTRDVHRPCIDKIRLKKHEKKKFPVTAVVALTRCHSRVLLHRALVSTAGLPATPRIVLVEGHAFAIRAFRTSYSGASRITLSS